MTEPCELQLLSHPYERMVGVTSGREQLKAAARLPGSALVWQMRETGIETQRALVESRPGGLALIVVLPSAECIEAHPKIVQAIHRCRPHGLLPMHGSPDPSDLAAVLSRPPRDAAAEMTDYLAWRGLVVDRETTHLLRRIFELSGELKTVTALSRGLYMSRRALGRRLMTRGLPVPSHWLQISRILRLASKLQNTRTSIFSLAYDAGYPDGFALSNQMQRLVGYRPSQAREYLGWEWIFEAWLRREAETGGLAPTAAREVTDGKKAVASPPAAFPRAKAGRPPRSRSAA